MISAGVTSYTGDGTSGMYFWGPQFESGTSPTIYEPTSSNAIPSPNAASKTDITGSVYVKNYFDEITYNPNSNVTPVNILSYTQDLDNAYWGKYQGSITPNVTVAPDGTLTADKWVENTVSGVEHFYYKGLAFVNTTLTGSVYLKAAERNRAVVGFSNFVNATAGVSFDLIAGTIIYTVPNNFDFINISGTITNVGNGWFRCTVTATKIGFTNTAANFQVTLITTGTTTVYTGDGTSGLYAWGHQVEFGSVATDYIPMNAAGVMATPRFVQRLTANGTNYVKANYDEFTGILPVTKGLILNLDPAVYDSYPGSGNTWTNLANNAISATFVNNTPSYSTDNGGVIRMTGRFEGNTYANTALPSNTFTPTSEKTFSIWVKFNSKMKSLTEYNAKITGYVYGTLATATQNTYGSTGILVGCSYFGDYGLNWILYRTSGSYYISVQSHNRVNLPTYQESTLGYDIGYSSTFDSAFDRWYNITSTYSSSLNSHVLYVNGNSVTSTTTITNGSPYPYSRPTITIGKNDIYGGNGFDCTFNGDIGQTLIYNRALTSAEVLQNYNIFKNRYGL